MKLYFFPGACSLCPHIVLRETDTPFDLERVDPKAKTTAKGEDFWAVSRTGLVPALRLDDGQVLTEVATIVQYIADKKPEAEMMPPHGSMERYRLLEWLNFLATELHKQNTPLFKPNTPDDYKPIAQEILAKSYTLLDKHLAGKQFMMGDDYTVADPYLFVMSNWLRLHKMRHRAMAERQGAERARARPSESSGSHEGGRSDQDLTRSAAIVISSPARSSPSARRRPRPRIRSCRRARARRRLPACRS